MNKTINALKQVGYGIIIGAILFSVGSTIVSNPLIVGSMMVLGSLTILTSDLIRLIIFNKSIK